MSTLFSTLLNRLLSGALSPRYSVNLAGGYYSQELVVESLVGNSRKSGGVPRGEQVLEA